MKRLATLSLALLFGACHSGAPLEQRADLAARSGALLSPVNQTIRPPLPAEAAPPPSARNDGVRGKDLPQLIARHFEGTSGAASTSARQAALPAG